MTRPSRRSPAVSTPARARISDPQQSNRRGAAERVHRKSAVLILGYPKTRWPGLYSFKAADVEYEALVREFKAHVEAANETVTSGGLPNELMVKKAGADVYVKFLPDPQPSSKPYERSRTVTRGDCALPRRR